ncbi:metal-sulfur cluster assembly factor [Sulfolobus sp. B1]|nr:metal-sulfur cluster assembly factor [Sulfolobus sp. A20-N-F8]TRM76546.1 metal-sulfur cluster assembly factor [Sulfolobus sp. E5]TRM79072.1 metal-sulfur cluster assembly factor [Sulfolobus sp. B5]TRM82263.1 metal-sulfur cluster assembly factor [Sulfolobus sp. D5]TRM84546.1 metal-sulfur cluster assembly factor [Sulfolobus sp. F3]TRM87995.1 metal-sulfur cluster assembly factor [Sulfolobus sp. C3]TRM89016.1 metal-sulfur cluster assembly factor [Sulfolobus sp. E3]TRM93750.1 metal-sulfur clust
MKDKIVEILRQIYDPEIPINIYDLGLVKRIDVDDSRITIDMILTAGNQCTIADLITVNVKYKVKREFPEYDVIVNVDKFAKWSFSMMTYEGRLMLEEIYGKEVVEKLLDGSVENVVKSLRIQQNERFDPKEYMRMKLEERYKAFREWLDRNRVDLINA